MDTFNIFRLSGDTLQPPDRACFAFLLHVSLYVLLHVIVIPRGLVYGVVSNAITHSSDARPKVGLVAIKNQGTMCYLNSLFQTLLSTRLFGRMFEAPV